MAKMLPAGSAVALSVCLASGLAGAGVGSHRAHAAGLALPALTLPDAVVRAQARPEPQLEPKKEPKKLAPRPIAPSAPSEPKARTRQDGSQGSEQPPQLVRCPGPSPECPPEKM